MRTINDQYAEQLAVKKSAPLSNQAPLSPLIAPKSVSLTRQDIKKWKRAEQLARMAEHPKGIYYITYMMIS